MQAVRRRSGALPSRQGDERLGPAGVKPAACSRSVPSWKAAEPPRKRLLVRNIIGPGLITGASDDDPSGIATYSQAGARFGFATCWTLVVTYPLMSAVQMISARIGEPPGMASPAILHAAIRGGC